MSRRGLLVAWLGFAVLFLVLFAWEATTIVSLVQRGRQAHSDVVRLTAAIQDHRADMLREMQAHADLVRDLRWSPDRPDPAVFLTTLADLARGARIKILAIGPLERLSSAQFVKAWHAVEVVAPYGELKDLMASIEREGGVLQDVVLERRPDTGPTTVWRDEIQAKVRVTTVALTAEAKRILDEARGVARPPSPTLAAALALPNTDRQAITRDPFAFMAEPVPAAPRVAGMPRHVARAAAPAGASEHEQLDVKGIVKFPGGFLAIVNDQIVKTGDTVSGYRVEHITERNVVLRPSSGPVRTVVLRDFHPAERK